MTHKETRKHKIKLISLILMCNYVKWRKQPPQTITDTIAFAIDTSYWMGQYAKWRAPLPKYPKGGLAIVGENNNKEVIIDRNGNQCN